MVSIDQCAPIRVLQAAFAPDDSIGVLLKTYRTGQVIQRIVPVASAISDRFQASAACLRSSDVSLCGTAHSRSGVRRCVHSWQC